MPNMSVRVSLRALVLGLAFGGAGAVLPGIAAAQAVVQPLPQQSPGMKLNDALGQLARNPQDIEALIAAGRASLDLGDVQAAIGFFQRADTLWPGSVRVKAGLAGAFALGGDPSAAIDMFKDAEKLGPLDAPRLADRGLAYDLVGDSSTAQFYYRRSLELAASDETARRLALSQAIAGDRRGMELTLGPLLQRQDKGAWRARAFALAILGVPDEADSIVHQTMPVEMANAMAPYLRYMPQLTPAQQAAAANLGQFPRAAEIGRDDPRFAAYVRPRAAVAVAAPPPAPGKKDRKKGKDRKQAEPQLAAASQPVPVPSASRESDDRPVRLTAITPAPAPQSQPPVRLTAITPAPTPHASPRPVPGPAPTPASLIAQSARAPAPAPVPAVAIAAPRPAPVPVSAVVPAPAPTSAPSATIASAGQPVRSFDLREQPAAVPKPAPSPAPRPAPKPESIDEAFADFTPPSREVEPAAGAVDLRQLERGKAAAAVAAKPGEKKVAAADRTKPGERAKPGEKGKEAEKAKDGDKKAKDSKLSQPSRVWVQVATGRDKAALGSDWRRMIKDDPAVFKGRKPFISAWGQTNRLLTGPFDSQKEAQAFIAALKKVDFDGAFMWTSPAGQVVDAVGAGK